MRIQITNQSSVVDNADLALWVTACAEQLREDWASAWEKVAPEVELNAGKIDPDAFQMILIDVAPQEPDALGWHQTDEQGKPIGYIPCKTILDAGDTISSVLSHELLEMAGDPYCSVWCQTADGGFRAFEMCDAVQGDSYTRKAGTTDVAVSNFLLPAYFVSTTVTGAKTDFLNKLEGAPGPARSPGGYDIAVTSAGQPTQEFSRQWRDLDDAKARRKSHPYSRTAKRKLGQVAA